MCNCNSPKINYKNIAKGFLRNVSDKLKITSPDISTDSRIRICKVCPNYIKGVCNICGCFIEAKTRVKEEKCPINKW